MCAGACHDTPPLSRLLTNSQQSIQSLPLLQSSHCSTVRPDKKGMGGGGGEGNHQGLAISLVENKGNSHVSINWESLD